jgi:starch-binding outer membrane protein, SusD/RagB family
MRPILSKGHLAGALVLALVACNADRLNVPNFQNATPESIQSDPATAVPLLAAGVLRDDRGAATTYVSGVGILGRESYNYTPTEGRNTSGYLTTDVNNQASFGGVSNWALFYNALRDNFNLLNVAEHASDAIFSAAQKNAVRGFAHTIEGLELSYVVSTRHDLGAPVEIKPVETELAAFVSRDSVYNHIIGRLDQARTELGQAGTSFPFPWPSGFTGFTTPANFTRVNRALAARVNAYRASLGVSGCGAARSAACYNVVLQNLAESFINPTGALDAGVYRTYSAASGENANGISNAATTSIVAHAKSDSGVQLKADATQDARFTAKILRLTSPRRPSTASLGVPTNWDHTVYPARDSRLPVIKNEELILLRAEARYYTGDQLGALDDLNTVRTRSGGLAAITLANIATEAAFLDELLYNRRWSLMFEGHRWVDMRRFGRLNQLTIDLSTHIVATQLPVPQAECLARARQTDAAMRGPGCT